MLTVAQYNRLPALARAVVDVDRAIRSAKSQPVTIIAFYRELVGTRQDLTKAADQTWGAPIRGDGTKRS